MTRDLGFVSLAIGLAVGSTFWLEAPIRQQKFRYFRGRVWPLWSGAVISVLLLGAATAEWVMARRYLRSTLAADTWDCMLSWPGATNGPCQMSRGESATIYLVGDSHADHWSPVVADWSKLHGVAATERALTGCRSVLAAYAGRIHDRVGQTAICAKIGPAVMDEIKKTATNGKPVGVIFSLFWDQFGSDSGLILRETSPAFDAVLDSLDVWKVRALILGPTPVFTRDPIRCLQRLSASACREPRSTVDVKIEAIRSMLGTTTVRHPNVRLWDPLSIFCDGRWCMPTSGHTILFRDVDHLSRRGARAAAGPLAPYFAWLAGGE